MKNSSALAAFLVLVVINVTGGQHYDTLQGLKQSFQQYQRNNYISQYNGVTTTPTTNKQNNKIANKNKTSEQRQQNEVTRTKKSVNQYDYVFVTTEKPIRKTTNSNQSRNITNKNEYSNIPYNQQEIDTNLNNKRTNNRNVDVSGISNPINKGTAINRGTANNRGIPNNNINTNNFDTTNNNANNRVNPNNFDTTNNNKNNRENNNFYTTNNANNRVNPNNFDTNRGNINNNNTKNQGNTDYDPSRITFLDAPDIFGVQADLTATVTPPFTNKPVGDKNDRLSDPSPVTFSNQPDVQPEILIGPDEDKMSEREKISYVSRAERACEHYTSLLERKAVAIPLIPSPEPVKLDVYDCTPYNVPIIVGEKGTSIRDFPHMALVGWEKKTKTGYSWKCGGSLISDRYILTAGHCTYQDRDPDIASGPPQAVQLGSSSRDGPGAVVVKISAVIRHPKYKQRTAYHDIALIKMVTKVTFSEVIHPACLGVPPPEGSSVVATGWGKKEYGGELSQDLHAVSLPVWSIEECREVLGTSLKLPDGVDPHSHMCAGVKSGGEGTCQGDSGGPVQTQDGCQWRVMAVISYGRSCGAAYTPSLYAVVPRAFVAKLVFFDQ